MTDRDLWEISSPNRLLLLLCNVCKLHGVVQVKLGRKQGIAAYVCTAAAQTTAVGTDRDSPNSHADSTPTPHSSSCSSVLVEQHSTSPLAVQKRAGEKRAGDV